MHTRPESLSDTKWLKFVVQLRLSLDQIDTMPDLFNYLCTQLPQVLHVDRLTLQLYHADLNCLVSEAFFGYERPAEQVLPSFGPQRPDHSISGRCFMENTPVVVEDCRHTDLIPARIVEELQLKSTLAVPVIHEKHPLGVIRVDDLHRINRFDRSDVVRLEQVAEAVGVAVSRLWPQVDHARTYQVMRSAFYRLEDLVLERTNELAAVNQKLRASEERFRGLAASALDGIVSVDARGRVVYANPAAAKLFDFKEEELNGIQVTELIPERFQDSKHRGIRKVLPVLYTLRRPGTNDVGLVARKRSGAEIPVECSFSIWRAGGRPFVTGIVRDVTERRRSEMVTRTFYDLGHSLSMAQTSREVGEAVLQAADKLIGWDSGYTDLLNEDQTERSSLISYDVIDGKRKEVHGTPHSQIGPLARKTLMEGPQLILRSADYHADAKYLYGDQNRPSLSMMYVPIQHQQRNVGILSIQSYAVQAYSEKDLDLFAALATFCSGALSRTAAEESLRQSQEALKLEMTYVHLLGTIAAAANSTNRLTDVLDTCLENVCQVTGWELGQGLIMSGGDGRSLNECVAIGSWHHQKLERWKRFCRSLEKLPISRNGGFPGDALLGLPVYVEDLAEHPHLSLSAPATEAGLKGAMAVPILLGKEVVALLLFFSTQPMCPSHRLLEVMHHAGVQLGRVVQRTATRVVSTP